MVAAMNGRIITARISEAVKMPVPKAGPWNRLPMHRNVAEHSRCTVGST